MISMTIPLKEMDNMISMTIPLKEMDNRFIYNARMLKISGQ